MSKLSGIRDVDREILSKVDDRELLKICSIDKYTWNNVCDDAFLRRRLVLKYSQIEQYKRENETWRQFFLRAIKYISKLKEEFNYVYTFGDFEKQYYLFNEYSYDLDRLLSRSSKKGELALVIYSLNNGADIHHNNELPLFLAAQEGNLQIIKYLVEHGGADINASDDLLEIPSEKGYLDVIKYLVKNGERNIEKYNNSFSAASFTGKLDVMKYFLKIGADANANDNTPIKYASKNGHLEAVKYLVEQGANVQADNNEALRDALENNHLEIAKYLISQNPNLK